MANLRYVFICIVSCWLLQHSLLAQSGTESALYAPNAYIVVPGNVVTIPVKKAYAVWQHLPPLKQLQADLSGTVQAELLWQDTQSLITNVQLNGEGENAVVNVTANTLNGNAVIAVKIGGVVRWSWHVWVTDYNPDSDNLTYNTTHGNVSFMNQNLGAVSVNANGLLYQFARNTPFVGSNGQNVHYSHLSAAIYNMENNMLDEGEPTGGNGFNSVAVTEAANLSAAIQHPFNFYTGNESNKYNWIGETLSSDTMWLGTNGKKGIFDPSPEGWRVPVADEYEFLTNVAETVIENFPKTGSRDYADGLFFMPGAQGMYWTATADNDLACYAFVSEQFVSPASSHYRTNAYSVRSIKDNSWATGLDKTAETTMYAFAADSHIVVGGLPENISTNLTLFNIQGQLIDTKTVQQTQTYIGKNLSKGIYLVKVNAETTLKVVMSF